MSSVPATEQMVDDLERQLDDAGIDKSVIVGNSLGGWLALRLAERGRASAVVCFAPAGGWVPGGPEERRLVRQFMLGRAVARRVENHPRILAIHALRRAVMQPVARTGSAASLRLTTLLMKDLAQCQALELAVNDPETRHMSRIEALDVPVHIIWSAADRVLDGEWARVRYQTLGASSETLPSVGHLAMLDDPQSVASLIRKQRGGLGH
jgi:pimeloyl-ACP methyl ester carboxylesterase